MSCSAEITIVNATAVGIQTPLFSLLRQAHPLCGEWFKLHRIHKKSSMNCALLHFHISIILLILAFADQLSCKGETRACPLIAALDTQRHPVILYSIGENL